MNTFAVTKCIVLQTRPDPLPCTSITVMLLYNIANSILKNRETFHSESTYEVNNCILIIDEGKSYSVNSSSLKIAWILQRLQCSSIVNKYICTITHVYYDTCIL